MRRCGLSLIDTTTLKGLLPSHQSSLAFVAKIGEIKEEEEEGGHERGKYLYPDLSVDSQ